jgi:peptidyl-prolyl cis-trans isomerase C
MRTVTLRNGTPQPVAVNGVVIAGADIAHEVQNHAGATPREAWHNATRALIVRELLLQRARSLKLAAEPLREGGMRETEEEALIGALLAAEITTPNADEASCRRYYQANLRRFRTPDLFEPRHILFKVTRDNAAAFAQAVARAEIVLSEVKAAPDRFASFASALSDCPSASDGGYLGQVARGDTTAEFEAALRSLTPGEIYHEPIQTRYGVHLLKLERMVAGELLPFGQVRDRIARYLEESADRRAMAQYVALLAGQAQITGFDMPTASSPLVQ